jgi:hypothetical protein
VVQASSSIINSYIDTNDPQRIIARSLLDLAGGFIANSSFSTNTLIEKSGIYQGIISSNGVAGFIFHLFFIFYNFINEKRRNYSFWREY